MKDHAATYEGTSPAAVLHRRRMRRVGSIVQDLCGPSGVLVDLGCSDGHVMAYLMEHSCIPRSWNAFGYDHSEAHVERARQRNLPSARFDLVDLNLATQAAEPRGSLVTCFEVLEHVGDWQAALSVIDASTEVGGRILVTMPNEVGVIGLGKLLVRPLIRRRPYRSFFANRSRVRYALAVASRRPLGRFRFPRQDGWGTHLGFDFREVLHTIDDRYVASQKWRRDRSSRPWSPIQLHVWTKLA